MRSGRLRHVVTLQRASVTQNEANEPIATWATRATVRASVEPLRGVERFTAGRNSAELSHRVWIRYYPGLSSGDRVLFGARVLEIVGIVNWDERNRCLCLDCVERAAEA